MSEYYGNDNLSNAHQLAVENARRKRRRKPPKRQFRMLCFKAYLDTDPEIVTWWDNMDYGERSDVMRVLLRSYLEGLPMYEAAQQKLIPVDGNTVREVYNDTRWIKEALSEMPSYLERLLGRLEAARPPVPISRSEPTVPGTHLTPEAQARRMAKMEKATW